MESLKTRLDNLAGRLMATTEHHQYAQLVLEAAAEIERLREGWINADKIALEWRMQPEAATTGWRHDDSRAYAMDIPNVRPGSSVWAFGNDGHCYVYDLPPLPQD